MAGVNCMMLINWTISTRYMMKPGMKHSLKHSLNIHWTMFIETRWRLGWGAIHPLPRLGIDLNLSGVHSSFRITAALAMTPFISSCFVFVVVFVVVVVVIFVQTRFSADAASSSSSPSFRRRMTTDWTWRDWRRRCGGNAGNWGIDVISLRWGCLEFGKQSQMYDRRPRIVASACYLDTFDERTDGWMNGQTKRVIESLIG